MIAPTTRPNPARRRPAARPVVWVPALALLLLAAGCSSDDSASDPGGSSTVLPDAPTGISFTGTGSGCVSGAGPYVLWDQMTVDDPLTVTGAELATPKGVELKDSWVTEPSDQADLSGFARGSQPPAAQQAALGWGKHEPLAGAKLQPDTTYVFVLSLDVPANGTFTGADLAWKAAAQGDNRYHFELTSEDCG